MKIEHIHKLILKFMGGGIVNFPTRFLKWIKVESCDCDGGGGDDGGGDEGGDSQDTITLEDFNSFYISVLNNNYVDTYQGNDTLQLSDIFEVPNINILKGLLTLGMGNVEANPDTYMHFNESKDDSEHENGFYEHAIEIHPSSGEYYNIEINTVHTLTNNENESVSYTYSIVFNYDGEDTLTVGYVNTPVIVE